MIGLQPPLDLDRRHWSERWIGWGRQGDCADFVSAVQIAEFGRRVALPASRPDGVRGKDAAMAAAVGRIAARRGAKCVDCGPQCNACVAPREGDLVLLRAKGRARAVGHHAGVFLAFEGRPHVLHWMRGLGGCSHPLNAAPGLVVEGIYRWL